MTFGMSSIGLNSYTFVVAIIVAICAIVVRYLNNRRFNELGSALPGPKYLPILGCMLIFIKHNGGFVDMLNLLLNKYPFICRLWMGPILWVLTKDAEAAKMILVDHQMINRGDWGDIFKTFFGDGLLTVAPESWSAKRKYIGNGFGSPVVRKFVPTIFSHAKTLVQRMEFYENGDEIDSDRMTISTIFDALFENMFGIRTRAAQSKGDDSLVYSKALHKIATIAGARFLQIWLYPDFIFNMTSLATQYNKYTKICDHFTQTVLRNKKESMFRRRDERETVDYENDAPTPLAAKRDLLEMLIDRQSNEKRLTDGEIQNEIDSITTAGVDTTAKTLCFTLLMLASHPDIQDRVYQELCEIFGNNVNDLESTITIHQLDRMEYLERVIKETLRVFPVTSAIPRKATKDLHVGEHLVPEGAMLFVSVFSLHRNAKYWRNPLEFDPDRFLPAEIEKRHRYAYMPFGAGPRNCIGQKYAILSIKIMCSTVLRKYVVKKDNPTPLANIKFTSSAILGISGSIRIKIKPRIKP